MRILLAEDEQDLNRIITQKLSADGYSVDRCFDGRVEVSSQTGRGSSFTVYLPDC